MKFSICSTILNLPYIISIVRFYRILLSGIFFTHLSNARNGTNLACNLLSIRGSRDYKKYAKEHAPYWFHFVENFRLKLS